MSDRFNDPSKELEDCQGHIVRGIQDHALIGNLKTAAVVSLDGSIESMCIPYFDSPSVFARIVDCDKGGHFSINPTWKYKPKQAYAPNSNILVTKFLSDEGVGQLTDLLVPKGATHSGSQRRAPLPWLIRKVESIRGKVPFRLNCSPAFNYCRDKHTAELVKDDSMVPGCTHEHKVLFKSKDLELDLRYLTYTSDDSVKPPQVELEIADNTERGLLGPSCMATFELEEGQCVVFVLRQVDEWKYQTDLQEEIANPDSERIKDVGIDRQAIMEAASSLRPPENPLMTIRLLESLISDTQVYWQKWISKCRYRGKWREAVQRSALVLKMLVFEETGAIIAAPTFALPEHVGGSRNWDYRFSWVRDTSFSLYALIRLGFTEEANAYVDFILSRLKDRNSDGSLQIVYTIHGGRDLEEIELDHLQGHKGSKPVRIGNGAADHLQLDIYGELLDCIYLAQKYSKPLAWESWVAVRQVIDYVCTQVDSQDLSIWEVRGKKKNFLYSKIMMWVAIDRGIRLADKRCLPCPNRQHWREVRDKLYEDIQTKGWNAEKGHFGQSYEDLDALDSAVLIMPLVFFISAADPRFTSTLETILKTPEKGGLTANMMVYRYNTETSDDGVGGEEGAFSLCTLWAVEALTRAGAYNPSYLTTAVNMFESFLGYGNHVALYSEEISRGGEGLGNTPQGFSHVTLISAAFNLDRALMGNNA
ncbi:Six-hairpin glycosidase-like protein [Kockovaella imperatae]|uniref:Six-hairpin glycosidase-like protein n=1 Tax=Kockovaella imperatae TaxID=4999 RepID=A0A1Y1UCC5_9TREE|nr:Six-hairpin glycosidase-like protein [Kockovaella imperatae]ORX35652.1 Six-hairpin glycosidase-like protein [Kockovaella imperatae]